jgi:hypothetical protein
MAEVSNAIPTAVGSSVVDEKSAAAPAGPRKTPFAQPASGCTPPPAAELTEDQQAKYKTVFDTVQSWTEIPDSTAKNASKSPLTDDDKLWLTRECLLRYLRATKWNTAEAAKRLQSTLTWRREYGVEKFTADYISPENETGKQVIMGFDKEGRACLYLLPKNQNTAVSDKQVHHLVYMLDRSIDMIPPGQETIALLIDFADTGSSKNPPVSQARQVLNILQGHYPERLGRALISNGKSFVPGLS